VLSCEASFLALTYYYLSVILWQERIVHLNSQKRCKVAKKHILRKVKKTARTANNAIGSCVSCKLKIAELQEESERLKKLVSHDPLTGALSRTEFMERTEHLLSLFRRNEFGHTIRHHFALIFIDLDNFEDIDDKCGGHEAGDNILKNFVRFLKIQLRDSDLIGRLSGDEFVLLLEESNFESGMKVVRKLKTALKKCLLSAGDGGMDIKIGISCGVVSTSEGISELRKLLKRADQRMYEDKSKKKIKR